MVTATVSQHITTQLAVPQDRAVPPQYASAGPTAATVESEADRLVDGRCRVARLQQFVADPSRREMTVPSAPLTTEQVASGLGSSGIFTIVEPPDLDLCRSYIPDPLQMPAVPQVALALVDFNRGNPVTRYPEGWVMVRATRPDSGQNLWIVASMPVANVLTAYIGLVWGLPKYVADEMTIARDRAEVIYEGNVRFSLELRPGSVSDEPVLRDHTGAIHELGHFQPHAGKQGIVPIHSFGRGTQIETAEWESGTVKAYISPDDPWAGLIPSGSESPGVFQRVADMGQGETVWQSIAGRRRLDRAQLRNRSPTAATRTPAT
jgi:hypothetical protein